MSATITEGFLDHRIFRIVSDAAEELGVRAFLSFTAFSTENSPPAVFPAFGISGATSP